MADDMIKEAFLDKATAHKIIYRLNPNTSTYQQIVFEGT